MKSLRLSTFNAAAILNLYVFFATFFKTSPLPVRIATAAVHNQNANQFEFSAIDEDVNRWRECRFCWLILCALFPIDRPAASSASTSAQNCVIAPTPRLMEWNPYRQMSTSVVRLIVVASTGARRPVAVSAAATGPDKTQIVSGSPIENAAKFCNTKSVTGWSFCPPATTMATVSDWEMEESRSGRNRP